MESAVFRWDDVAFRKSLLFVGLEEATFYRPRVEELDCASFVVMCIRNSLIEDLAASRAATVKVGLVNPVLTDKQMPEITSAAIEWFVQVDFDAATNVARANGIETDLYGSLPIEYPHAWHLISSLANAKSDSVTFEASVAPKPALLAPSSETDRESIY